MGSPAAIEWTQVFDLLNRGLNQRQIAEKLETSRKTVWKIIETFREIDELVGNLGIVKRNWEDYLEKGQVRPKNAEENKMQGKAGTGSHTDKEYYAATRFLTSKEVHRVLHQSVESIANPDGSIEYFLYSEKIKIGKLDPKRQWAQKVINGQVRWLQPSAERPSQDDDGSSLESQSGELPKAGSGPTEGQATRDSELKQAVSEGVPESLGDAGVGNAPQ